MLPPVAVGAGFVLAGGYALQAHQLVDRMSEDVDLFTDRWDSNELGRAVEAVMETRDPGRLSEGPVLAERVPGDVTDIDVRWTSRRGKCWRIGSRDFRVGW